MCARGKVYMDITIDDVDAGRVEIGLFSGRQPRTTKNFKVLCAGAEGKPGDFEGVRLAPAPAAPPPAG
jgi:hypothetical protein